MGAKIAYDGGWTLNPHAAEAGAQEACPDGTGASVLRLTIATLLFYYGENKEKPRDWLTPIWSVNG